MEGSMKKKRAILIYFVFLMGVTLVAQQQSFIEQSLVVNIEVPVRVFDGPKFVADLTIKDFELLENGVEQKIEAVYLISDRSIERSDEKKRFMPDTERSFYLFFEIEVYTPELQRAMRLFIDEVYLPGDNLIIVTPIKTYRLKQDATEIKNEQEILEEMRGFLRRDSRSGNTEFRNTVDDLEDLAQNIQSDIDLKKNTGGALTEGELELLDRADSQRVIEYAGLMTRLQTMRQADELRLLDLADHLKGQMGQKYVFMFWERKYIPQVEPQLIKEYLELWEQDPYMEQTLSTILDDRLMYNTRETYLDLDRIKKKFADSSTAIHFLQINRPRANRRGIKYFERAEDTYHAFREIVEATGGYSESSQNPEYLFKNALDASRNYYLIYYSPKEPKGDGEFKNIKVRIKGEERKLRILHRAGYFDY